MSVKEEITKMIVFAMGEMSTLSYENLRKRGVAEKIIDECADSLKIFMEEHEFGSDEQVEEVVDILDMHLEFIRTL